MNTSTLSAAATRVATLRLGPEPAGKSKSLGWKPSKQDSL